MEGLGGMGLIVRVECAGEWRWESGGGADDVFGGVIWADEDWAGLEDF